MTILQGQIIVIKWHKMTTNIKVHSSTFPESIVCNKGNSFSKGFFKEYYYAFINVFCKNNIKILSYCVNEPKLRTHLPLPT